MSGQAATAVMRILDEKKGKSTPAPKGTNSSTTPDTQKGIEEVRKERPLDPNIKLHRELKNLFKGKVTEIYFETDELSGKLSKIGKRGDVITFLGDFKEYAETALVIDHNGVMSGQSNDKGVTEHLTKEQTATLFSTITHAQIIPQKKAR